MVIGLVPVSTPEFTAKILSCHPGYAGITIERPAASYRQHIL